MNLILIPESGPGMLKDDQCIGTLNRAEAPACVADFRAGFEPFQSVARTFPGARFVRKGPAGRRRDGYANFAARQDGGPSVSHRERPFGGLQERPG